MKLGKFIEKFIEKNSIIRLVYIIPGGHKIVQDTWDDVGMAWEVLNGKGINRHFIDNNVLGIASIMTNGHYSEAINIVIEELDNQQFIK